MSYCDLEDAPEFFRETKQRASKPYVCDECEVAILAGESYWRSTGKWGDTVTSYRQHPWCRAVCTHLSVHAFDGCIGFATMLTEWDENYAEFHHNKAKHRRLRHHMARVLWEMRNPARRVALRRAA